MNIPKDLLYTKEHEWIKVEGDTGIIGITEYAQHALGDVTFIEMPKQNTVVKQFQILTTIESVKAASDVYAPLSGTILDVNTKLENTPGLINQSCYQDGWITKIKIKDADEKKNLMESKAYQEFVEGLNH